MKPNQTQHRRQMIVQPASIASNSRKTRSFAYRLRHIAICCMALMPLTAQAVDLNWSGFATLGYVRSNQSYVYDGIVSDRGTIKRDSLLGFQLESTFSPKWSSTLQARYAPSLEKNLRWEPELAWAFVSYRPTNDWLLRAGKLRMPMYLFSENMDVGASYDVVRMPTEVYTTAPSSDYSGISLARTWQLDSGEFNIEAYAGKTSLKASVDAGSASLRTRTTGLVFKLHQNDNVFHLGLQQAFVGLNVESNRASGNLGNGQNGQIPNDGLGPTGDAIFDSAPREIDTRILLLGADLQLRPQLRLVSEYAKRTARGVDVPHNSTGAYVILLNNHGAWTPYISYARLLTDKSARQPKNNRSYFDQSTIAIGTSYALSAKSKLKAEWVQIRIGSNSLLLESNPLYNSSSHQRLNVFSLTYSAIY